MVELTMSTSITDFDAHIARTLRAPLSAAQAAAKAGSRVVGYVGAEIPVELLFAANAVPVRLRGVWDAPTPNADRYLESSFVPESRAIAEQWLSGQLDFLDSVIFPRSNDSAQRLYYYLCELQRRQRCKGPKPLLYDIAGIARETSREHTLAATAHLAAELGFHAEQLSSATQRVARRAAQLRAESLAGSDAHRIVHAADCDWSESFDVALDSYLASRPKTPPAPRIILAGSPPPDERLHRAAELGGASITRDLTEAAVPSVTEATLAAIAARFQQSMSPAQAMLRSTDWLLNHVKDAGAQGVILWLIEEDEALPWEVANQARALAAASIPVLSLTRQAWRASSETLDAITQFARSLAGAP
jgi:benzoyl-CoA reductase/2-hydroxyglutaryl-CoA dehydratase subunit BcrC/BadD/HgdB